MPPAGKTMAMTGRLLERPEMAAPGISTNNTEKVSPCPKFWNPEKILRNEKSAQRGSFRPDVPADIRPKTSVRPSKSWKNYHFGTDMPRGRPRKNFGLKNFGLIFRCLNTRKIPQVGIFGIWGYFSGIFGVFSGYFGVFSRGPEFQAGV